MGLFGRDDRPPQATPSATSANTPREPAQAPQVHAKTTLLSKATSFEGGITGSGDVTLEGELKGSVRISGRLVIAQSGNAKASLHGKTVQVAGTVKGDVTADEKIELLASARLNGNITAPRILIQEGAVFEGQVVMKDPNTGKPGSGKPEKTAAPGGGKKPGPGPNAST